MQPITSNFYKKFFFKKALFPRLTVVTHDKSCCYLPFLDVMKNGICDLLPGIMRTNQCDEEDGQQWGCW